MFVYKKPQFVNSPKAHLKIEKLIYDGGIDPGYSIALVKWDGSPAIALRWNISQGEYNDPLKEKGIHECIGNPQSRGVATWFILPDDNEFMKQFEIAITELKTI